MSNSFLNRRFFTITSVLLVASTLSIGQTKEEQGNLHLAVSNFSSNAGKAIANLYRIGDKMPSEPYLKLESSIVNGASQIDFNHLSYGYYAIILVHDENSNGIIDHSFGFPAEPLAFSNHWSLSLFSGMPTFEKLKFSFQESGETVLIKFE